MRKFVSINNFKGLHTAEGVLGAPEGSFEIADNVDFPDATKVQSRRPLVMSDAPALAGTPLWLMSGAYMYGGQMSVNTYAAAAVNSDSVNPTMLVSLSNGSAIPMISSTPVFGSSLPVRSARFGSNLYMTSEYGVIRLELLGDDRIRWAGMAQAHAPYNSVVQTTGAGSWLQSGYATAYRFVYAYHMRDGSILRSAPSHKVDVANTGGSPTWLFFGTRYVCAANSRLTDAFDPDNSETVDVEVYRSPQVPGLVGTDEMQLCFKRPLTNAEKTASLPINIEDKCPDAALGAYLYTNANTGDTIVGGVSAGLAGRNDEPPRCTDLATHANRLFFSNIRQKYTLDISLIAVGTSGAVLKTGDVITVGGFALTAGTHFQVYTAGSIAQNISQTAINLAYAINDFVAGVKAEYVGNPLSLQSVGLIRLTARSLATGAFTIQVTSGGSGAAFVPNADSAVWASQEEKGNWLAWSKDGQPDAVPPVNYTTVGRGVIDRIIPSRDALYIMASDGLWRLTGNTEDNFAVEMVDSTFRLVAPGYVAAIGDMIYAWTTHGISVITTNGVVPIDGPIKNIVRQYRLRGLSGGFAVADRSTDRVLFFLPAAGCYATASKHSTYSALVFNAHSKAWSRYVYPRSMPIADVIEVPEDLYSGLLFALSDNGGGTSQYSDASDEWPTDANPFGWFSAHADSYAAGPPSVASTAVEALFGVRGLSHGARDARGEGTSADKSVKSLLRWTSHSGDPFAMAQWHDLALFLSDDSSFGSDTGVGQLDVMFETDKDGPVSDTKYIPAANGTSPIRVVVPSESARGQKMTITVRNSWIHRALGLGVEWDGPFSMSGIGLTYDIDGVEVSR